MIRVLIVEDSPTVRLLLRALLQSDPQLAVVGTAVNGEDVPAQSGDRKSQLYFADAIGYVRRVVVHPDYRGQGLSRRLMEHIITYARNPLGLAAIDLHVWENNIPAIRLYESLGFQLQHRELYFHLPL